MTNETTASQPKSIGDDAQFQKRLAEYDAAIYPGQKALRLVSLIALIDRRAPAAQASATIQAAPTFECSTCHGAGWVPRDPDIGTEQECFSCGGSGEDEEAALIAQAATIQEPVMVAEPVGKARYEAERPKLLVPKNWPWESLPEAIQAEFNRRAAPMVADPAGVALTVWCGAMPESNGKSNFTALLMRKGGDMVDGITIDRSEYPDRVRYEADRVRYLLGELTEPPFILDYDADKHSGYVPPAATVKAVPSEALEMMKEARALAPILRGMCEGGGEERDVDIYAANYSAGDGDIFVQRAADLLEDFAAPLADKTGGGE